jgi:hypothetical protein
VARERTEELISRDESRTVSAFGGVSCAAIGWELRLAAIPREAGGCCVASWSTIVATPDADLLLEIRMLQTARAMKKIAAAAKPATENAFLHFSRPSEE